MKRSPDAQQLIACRVCLSEIPASVASAAEGRDYVHYFCGAECYSVWIQVDTTSQDTLAASREMFCAA